MNVSTNVRYLRDARVTTLPEMELGVASFIFGRRAHEADLLLTGTRDERITMLRKWAHAEGYALLALPEEVR